MEDINKRVKFYSINDMSLNWNINSTKKILSEFKEVEYSDINDILELFNIKKIIDNDVYKTQFDSNEYSIFKNIVKDIPSIYGKFFGKLNDETILSVYEDVLIMYVDDFWEIFNILKLYNKISEDVFIKLADAHNLEHVLKYKNIVNKYDEHLKELIVNNNEIELILNHLLGSKKDKDFFPPKCLSLNDILDMIKEYLNSENPNPNYLELIINSSNDRLKIPDYLKYRAKKSYDNFLELNLKGNGIPISVEIIIAEDNIKDFPVVYDYSDSFNLKIYISIKYINKCKKPLEHFNNFVNIFDFVDSHFRSNFISKPYEGSELEKLLLIKNDKYYPINLFYKFKDLAYNSIVCFYIKYLLKNNSDIEEIIKRFFSSFLLDQFQVGNFLFTKTNNNTNIETREKGLISQIDRIIKQYKLLVEYKVINQELLEMSSTPIKFSDVPSFINDKYAYIADNLNGTEIKNMINLIFSDQSLLAFIPKNKEYTEFYKHIIHSKITEKDLKNYQINIVNELIEKDILKKCNGYYKFNDVKFKVLYDLYHNNYLCLSYWNGKEMDYIRELLKEDCLVKESTLLSRDEQNYLDFKLNKRKYENGDDLRNKYLHSSNSVDENLIFMDYCTTIKIFIMIMVKIYEDLSLNVYLNKK